MLRAGFPWEAGGVAVAREYDTTRRNLALGGVLDDIGIDLDPTVTEETDKVVPAAQAMADRLGDGALA